MEDMTNNPEVTTTTTNTNQDYIDAINELKRNSVSREEYDKIREENRNLLNSLVNGQQIQQEVVEEKATADELRQQLFYADHDLSNLEYVDLSVKLRDAVLEETGQDIFVANNSQLQATREAYEAAEQAAQVFKECIAYAQGDSEVFTNELMRRTIDVQIPRSTRR